MQEKSKKDILLEELDSYNQELEKQVINLEKDIEEIKRRIVIKEFVLKEMRGDIYEL